MSNEKTRTYQQNRAMHKYFSMLSDQLNSAGLTVEKTMSQPIELDWTPAMIKELMWRKVQLAVTEKESTTKLERKEITQIYEIINRHLAQTFGIHVQFPTKEMDDM